MNQLRGNESLDRQTADAIAHAVKVWAIERGATHFTHWFQPITDSTAEKHDSFLTLKSSYINGFEEVKTRVYIVNDPCFNRPFVRLLLLKHSLDPSYCNQNQMHHPSLQVECEPLLKHVVILSGTRRGMYIA